MGLKLGRLLKKTVRSVAKRAPALVGGFLTGGPMGAGLALGQSLISKATSMSQGGVGGGIPSIEEFTGVGPFMPTSRPLLARTGNGMVEPVAGVTPFAVVGMSRAVAMAITKMAVALGIPLTLAKLSRVGLRLYRTISTFARRHPGISILGWLASLGLLADEAAEFMLWGQTKQRRRRGRGISAREIRICRRTIRKMAAFRRDLGSLGPPGRRGGAHHHHPRGGVV